MKDDIQLFNLWHKTARALIEKVEWNENERHVKFECPLCGGEAVYQEFKYRHSWSKEEEVHARGVCEGCDISVIS